MSTASWDLFDEALEKAQDNLFAVFDGQFDLPQRVTIANERDFSGEPVVALRGVGRDSAADTQPQPADKRISAPYWASPSPIPFWLELAAALTGGLSRRHERSARTLYNCIRRGASPSSPVYYRRRHARHPAAELRYLLRSRSLLIIACAIAGVVIILLR